MLPLFSPCLSPPLYKIDLLTVCWTRLSRLEALTFRNLIRFNLNNFLWLMLTFRLVGFSAFPLVLLEWIRLHHLRKYTFVLQSSAGQMIAISDDWRLRGFCIILPGHLFGQEASSTQCNKNPSECTSRNNIAVPTQNLPKSNVIATERRLCYLTVRTFTEYGKASSRPRGGCWPDQDSHRLGSDYGNFRELMPEKTDQRNQWETEQERRKWIEI